MSGEQRKQIAPNFSWSLDGRVVTIDNGCTLAATESFEQLMRLNTFAVIAFDPANRLSDREKLKDIEEFQLVAGATLGDGQPSTMYACLDASYSSTLKPIPPDDRVEVTNLTPNRVIAEYPISTVSLDSIEGLKSVDWLILDGLNDNVAILESGSNTLSTTLLIQVRIPLSRSHHDQNDLLGIQQWMNNHGFRLYCWNNIVSTSNLPTCFVLEKEIATELQAVDAIYIPDRDALARLSHSQLIKLSFIIHTVYGCHDLTYKLLEMVDPDIAASYLMSEGYIWPVDRDETTFELTLEYSPEIWN